SRASPHRPRQPERDFRKDHQQHCGHHDRQREYAASLVDIHQIDAGGRAHHEGEQPDRREYQPHRHHHHRQHAEPDRVDCERRDQRERERHRQQQQRDFVHEHADDEIRHHDTDNDDPAVELHGGYHGHHL